MRGLVLVGASVVVLFVTAWQFREMQRLERILGSEVGPLQAAGAFKLRQVQSDRDQYPIEWHTRVRWIQRSEFVRLGAAILAFAQLIRILL